MQLTTRPYQGEGDYWRIRAFLRELLPLNNYREVGWHVVRFDYWRWHGAENIERMRLEDVIQLWETEDGHICAVLTPEGRGEAFLHVHPDFRTPELLEEMVTLAETRLSVVRADGQHSLRIWVEEHEGAAQGVVARHGYLKGDGPEYMRQRSIDTPFPQALPAQGYNVRSLGDGVELIERCYASGLAFHDNDIHIAAGNRDVAWYRNIQNAPLYRRDLDIVAIAPDGAVASFCTAWFDDVTRTGVFEPVATVPAHQWRGLGKVVMSEGLRRLKRIGATRAYVSSYSPEAGALYAAMGFTDYDLLEPWEKRW
jgi:mycothiol synthase